MDAKSIEEDNKGLLGITTPVAGELCQSPMGTETPDVKHLIQSPREVFTSLVVKEARKNLSEVLHEKDSNGTSKNGFTTDKRISDKLISQDFRDAIQPFKYNPTPYLTPNNPYINTNLQAKVKEKAKNTMGSLVEQAERESVI